LLGIGDVLLSFCLKSRKVGTDGHNLLKYGDKRHLKSMKNVRFMIVKMLKAEKKYTKVLNIEQKCLSLQKLSSLQP